MSQKQLKRPETRQRSVSSSKNEKPRTPKAKKPSSNGVNGTSKDSHHHNHNQKSGDRGTSGRSSSDEDEVTKMNLKTLQKVDRRVSSILATVPHVVLYQYRTAENMWVSVLVGVV